MGKISNVYYEEISSDKMTNEEAGEFYFLYNLIGLDSNSDKEYERFEKHQMEVKNEIIKEAMSSGDLLKHPKMNSVIMALSSYKEKPVLIVEY